MNLVHRVVEPASEYVKGGYVFWYSVNYTRETTPIRDKHSRHKLCAKRDSRLSAFPRVMLYGHRGLHFRMVLYSVMLYSYLLMHCSMVLYSRGPLGPVALQRDYLRHALVLL